MLNHYTVHLELISYHKWAILQLKRNLKLTEHCKQAVMEKNKNYYTLKKKSKCKEK